MVRVCGVSGIVGVWMLVLGWGYTRVSGMRGVEMKIPSRGHGGLGIGWVVVGELGQGRGGSGIV